MIGDVVTLATGRSAEGGGRSGAVVAVVPGVDGPR